MAFSDHYRKRKQKGWNGKTDEVIESALTKSYIPRTSNMEFRIRTKRTIDRGSQRSVQTSKYVPKHQKHVTKTWI